MKDKEVMTPACPAGGEICPETNTLTAEEWRDRAADKKQSYPGGYNADGVYRMAKVLHGWPVGKLLTCAEYDQAVKAALSVPMR